MDESSTDSGAYDALPEGQLKKSLVHANGTGHCRPLLVLMMVRGISFQSSGTASCFISLPHAQLVISVKGSGCLGLSAITRDVLGCVHLAHTEHSS